MDKWKEGQFTAESVTGKGPVDPLVMGWISIKDKLPDYYDLVWASDGKQVVMSQLIGASYIPPKIIWRNKERNGGCDELYGIKFWMPVFKPRIP